MNTLLAQKNCALERAVWPLGRPEQAYEIPMWQDICREWVIGKMQPTNVTHLIEELLRTSDTDAADTTASDIRQAVLAAADWKAAVKDADWRSTEDMIEELLSRSDEDRAALLLQLVCLVVHGFADTADYEDAPDCALYWVRRNPTWKDGAVDFEWELLDWADMTDTYIKHRAHGDAVSERNTGHACEYRLGRCSARSVSEDPAGRLWFSDREELLRSLAGGVDTITGLPDGKFLPLSKMIENCRHAVTAWVISEWLEPHGFVNFDQADWSSLTSWQELGEEVGLEVGGRLTEPEVAQWFIVSESAAESLRETGAVVSGITGSSNGLFGRIESGQSLHLDGHVQNAIVHSGYLDRIPPLGALHSDTNNLPRIKFTLGGEEFPFRVYGYSEHRPDRELGSVILDPFYRENGWCVIWGPSFESMAEGLVRMFRLSPVTPERHPEPLYHEG